MSLAHNHFDVLRYLEKVRAPQVQRVVAEQLGRSLGTINKVFHELAQLGYLKDGQITDAGLEALEPYRAKRAIILAAGFGERMLPLTLNTPKPLMRVQGTRIIDSLLDALTAVGIGEIYLVRGYLAEQLDQLLYKYPGIRFLSNPYYHETNNISSVLVARDHLPSAYILEGDLLLRNPDLIEKYQYESNYLGVPVSKTDDWCFYTNGKYIKKIGVGGTNCHHMFGISYWNAADGARLAGDVETVFNTQPGGKQRMWDQVAVDYFPGKYQLGVRECSFDDIVEIDTYEELCALDSAYRL
ncbi:MAG: NTP transferase domain-containing protein [Coriobacteriales bacterium]|jgi:CTP:phosphocholine cytidylyltransferase-like protein|nr:NTP transferase domain-containing protein [Coriobacteriales bacterium]